MIKRELGVFLVVGILSVLIDFFSYHALLGLDVNIAKTVGFLSGALFAYFANRYWTFGYKPHVPGSIWRFAILYASTLGANVLVNYLALKWFSNISAPVLLAFLIV